MTRYSVINLVSYRYGGIKSGMLLETFLSKSYLYMYEELTVRHVAHFPISTNKCCYGMRL